MAADLEIRSPDRAAILEIRLETEPREKRLLFPAEFASLLDYTSRLTERIADLEGRDLLEAMDVPPPMRLHALRRPRRGPKPRFQPGYVSQVGEKSVELVVVMAASYVVAWAIRNLFGPAVEEAWEGSHDRKRLVTWTREHFLGGDADPDAGARRVEEALIEERPPERMRVEDVKTLPSSEPDSAGTVAESGPRIRVTLIQIEGPPDAAVEAGRRLLRDDENDSPTLLPQG